MALRLVALILLILALRLKGLVRLHVKIAWGHAALHVASGGLRLEGVDFIQELHEHLLNPGEIIGTLGGEALKRTPENAPLLGIDVVVDSAGLRVPGAARIRAWATDGTLDRLLCVLLDLGDNYIFGIGQQTLEVLKVVAHLRGSADQGHQELCVACAALGIANHQLCRS